MKERPILFSGPMVRKILAGEKTQTRRLVKPQPARRPNWSCHGKDGLRFGTGKSEQTIAEHCLDKYLCRGDESLAALCPYDADRLWVRETWRPFMEAWDCGVEFAADGGRLSSPDRDRIGAFPKLSLRFPSSNKERHSDNWRPSIHMPRWASRLTLGVTSIRVERLHDISEEDARAEGAERAPAWDPEEEHLYSPDGIDRGAGCGYGPVSSHYQGFADLWTSINGAASWDANPWVWVVSFARSP